jgi:hypothetical protein
MTLAEFVLQVNAKLPDNDQQLITAAKLREILVALATAVNEGGFD